MKSADYFALCNSLVSRTSVLVSGLHHGKPATMESVVQAIQAEDGSGRNLNVTLANGATLFVRLTR